MKKLGIKFIKDKFAAEDYTLLSNRYVNSKQKLKYTCPNGHKHQISWNEWNSGGNRCPYCAGNGVLTIEYVRNSFEQESFTLLTNTYKNSNSKLKYICNNGHRHKTTWNIWRSGFRCPYCSGKIKKTIEFIKSEFSSEGYIVLDNTYKNVHTKLHCMCPLGHEYITTWAAWSQGKRCFICKTINFSGENHPNWKGGVSCDPYCDAWADKEYKESIKVRDGYKCLNPMCSKKIKRISIHHINYNKKDCQPNNLITLCASCNTSANYDRDWHKEWYRAVMYNRYNYIY